MKSDGRARGKLVPATLSEISNEKGQFFCKPKSLLIEQILQKELDTNLLVFSTAF